MSRAGHWFSLRFLIHLLLVRPFVRIVFGVDATGRENLKGLDRYIIIANHNSHLDILLLFQVLPMRDILRTRPVAAGDYFFDRRLLRLVVDYLFRPIWILRGGGEPNPVAKMQEGLNAGDPLILFPEGTRGSPGRIEKFRSGVGVLAKENPGLPIVPVFLGGPERAYPKESIIPVPIWNSVVIGPPRSLSGLPRDVAATLEREVRDLARLEVGDRHTRPERKPDPVILAVLGIDGSGKSTLASVLARELSMEGRASLIGDGLQIFEGGGATELQPLLTERLRTTVADFARSRRSLKGYRIPKLAELLIRDRLVDEVRRWYMPRYIVMDGSPLLNMAAWAVVYRGEGLDPETCWKGIQILAGKGGTVKRGDPVYERLPEIGYLKALRSRAMCLPDVVVFLDVDPANAVERVITRGDRRQAHETPETLARLSSGYHLVLDVLKDRLHLPVLRVGGSPSREKAAGDALAFVRDVLKGRSTDD